MVTVNDAMAGANAVRATYSQRVVDAVRRFRRWVGIGGAAVRQGRAEGVAGATAGQGVRAGVAEMARREGDHFRPGGKVLSAPGFPLTRVFLSRVSKLALMLFVAISTASYGATFKRQMDNDGPICTTFLEDLKAAHIDRMTDAQLCDLDLSKIMRGFDFPTWQRRPEMDGIATLEKILRADQLPHSDNDDSKGWPQQIDYAKELDHKHLLYVESTTLTQLGTAVHVLQVAAGGCFFRWNRTGSSSLKMTPDTYGFPEFSFVLDPGPAHELPFFMNPGFYSGTLSNFGKGKRQILGLMVDHSWAVVKNPWAIDKSKHGFMTAMVTGFSFEVPKPDSTNHIDKEAGLKPYIYNFPICQFDISINAKELSHE